MHTEKGVLQFMKIAGIILIVLQVLSIAGGGFPTGGSLAFYLGFFAPGIIGVILLIKGIQKAEAKKNAEQNNENQ